MRKRLFAILAVCVLTFSLAGCGITYQEATGEVKTKSSSDDFGNGFFTTIVKWSDSSNNYSIIYANDTNVKYMVITTGYKMGITPLFNADGTLQIYEGQ